MVAGSGREAVQVVVGRRDAFARNSSQSPENPMSFVFAGGASLLERSADFHPPGVVSPTTETGLLDYPDLAASGEVLAADSGTGRRQKTSRDQGRRDRLHAAVRHHAVEPDCGPAAEPVRSSLAWPPNAIWRSSVSRADDP